MAKVHKIGGSLMIASHGLHTHLGLSKGSEVVIEAKKLKGKKCLVVTKKGSEDEDGTR